MPSSSNSMPPGTFFSKAVEEKYNTNTSKRPFCMEKDNAFFYVRGVSVLFDEYSINAQYGLLESPDEHSKFVKTITIEGLNQVLVDLCVEGTKWTVSRNDYYIFDRVSLKPFLGSLLLRAKENRHPELSISHYCTLSKGQCPYQANEKKNP
ncbi:hypothetical protein J1N35_046111 [Gossypium stocksii]|uniref:Uncharacterized protein n=1 Tax=Gossypium stocksii TaxID=47602 RepID=A0A9D3U5L7_9ROSI|nr:hypothetical protein J1N35_046111 [Gossypium stocksii]